MKPGKNLTRFVVVCENSSNLAREIGTDEFFAPSTFLISNSIVIVYSPADTSCTDTFAADANAVRRDVSSDETDGMV